MFKLTTPTSLPLLNLPTSALEALRNEILGPVDDINLFTAFWNETARSWTSQTPPPSSKKPKQKPG